MSKWPGKFVIGLTGNIGTGKSVIRKMLEHLGAYGIDADALSHRAISKGAPGYQLAVNAFGQWIVGADGQIDRSKLGKVVFNDPAALTQLEAIVHPLVDQAIDYLVHRTNQNVIVIEAIKLLESNLHKQSDAVWVTVADPEIQLQRLVQQRKMTEVEARLRIQIQSSQEEKKAAAHVVINNSTTFMDAWRQVNTAWLKYIPQGDLTAAPPSVPLPIQQVGTLSILRGKPRHSGEIAGLINRLSRPTYPLTSDDIMAAFGEKAFFLLQMDSKTVGLLGCQVENLVSRTTDIFIDPSIPASKVLPVMIAEMEKASKELLCEASLVFVNSSFGKLETVWKELGYTRSSSQELGVQAWREAVEESMPLGSILFFKQLRQDRILRPV